MALIDRELAARLPFFHEAQERQESENVFASGLGAELGIERRDWGDGLSSIRTREVPNHWPGNQITGPIAEHLERLPEIIDWFDEAGCSCRLRWPGPTLDKKKVGGPLNELGFVADELEAWMTAAPTALAFGAPSHDIREVVDEASAADFVTAFHQGWNIVLPDKQRISAAAMGRFPGPDFWRRYVAYVDGEPAGDAVLALFPEAAYLAEASTVPRFRRRGIQRAMIAHRARVAAEAGAQALFVCVVYGQQSWANMRAAGLEESYMTLTFARSPRS